MRRTLGRRINVSMSEDLRKKTTRKKRGEEEERVGRKPT